MYRSSVVICTTYLSSEVQQIQGKRSDEMAVESPRLDILVVNTSPIANKVMLIVVCDHIGLQNHVREQNSISKVVNQESE